MKPKKNRYILLAATVCVWGIIIYKIVIALNKNTDYILSVIKKKDSITVIDKNDSFFLYQNYPDPFLPENDTITTEFSKNNNNATQSNDSRITSVPFANTTPKANISFVKYHGMIFNPSRKVRAALITINDKELTMKERESAENITLLKVFKDKIQVLYNHKSYIIFKLI